MNLPQSSTPVASAPQLIAADHVEAAVADPRRLIVLDNVHNFRDLGGYPTAEGRTTRWNVLYRADGVQRVTDDDLERVSALGIRTVIDLRSSGELDTHGRFPWERVAARFEHLPVLESVWQESDLPPLGGEHDLLVWAYRDMLATGWRPIADALTLLGSADSLPAVFHCAAGKDRTGVVAALLLSALGVEREFILADYALSTGAVERMRAWARREMPEMAERFAAAPAWMFAALPTALDEVLDCLVGEHGSIEEYLGSIGVEHAVVDRLRTALLEAPLGSYDHPVARSRV